MCVCMSIDVFAYQLVLPIEVNIPSTKLYSLMGHIYVRKRLLPGGVYCGWTDRLISR